MSQSQRPQLQSSWAHPIRAVAFDMDGLLVNTEDLYTEVGDTILRRRGKRFTAELKDQMMGLPGPKAFQVMIDYAGLDDNVDQLARESDEVFAEILPRSLALMPGVLRLLDDLDRIALPRCIATSSKRSFAEEVLRLTHLHKRIDFVITADDVPRGKPFPDIYLRAGERLKVSTSHLLVLEDSQNGCRAGVASGACTVAVPGQHSQNHDFDGSLFVAQTLADPRIAHLLSPNHSA